MKYLITALILALIVGGAFMLKPKKAKCAICPTLTCYSSSMCGSGCVCIKQGMRLDGYCASIE